METTVSLLISPKNTYNPLSPPSGRNRYPARYVMQERIKYSLAIGDLSIYVRVKSFTTKKIIEWMVGIAKTVRMNLRQPIFIIQERTAMNAHKAEMRVNLIFAVFPVRFESIIE